jgi:hypothetical protein
LIGQAFCLLALPPAMVAAVKPSSIITSLFSCDVLQYSSVCRRSREEQWELKSG